MNQQASLGPRIESAGAFHRHPGNTVFLTGATGFIGSHLAQALTARDTPVRCGVRTSPSSSWLEGRGIETVPFDLRNPASFKDALTGVQTVVHLAALTHAQHAHEFEKTNAEGTRHLLEAAREAGVKRFVFASSLAARGPSPYLNGCERPESAYGRSKYQAERYVLEEKGLETVILRLAGVYGPRDRDMLPLFRMARQGFFIVPNGAHLLQPLYIDDAVDALITALPLGGSCGTYEVAEPVPYTWAEVVRLFSKAVNRHVRPIKVPALAFTLAGRGAEVAARARRIRPSFDARRARDFAVHTWLTDAATLEKDLHWSAKVPLPTGLAATASWYQQEGWLPT